MIYPDVVQAFAPQANFGATVQNVLGSWNWAYGYPYLPISASVLILPRLIFGSEFSQHVQLNIFLMRQFVSVLPMVLALMLAVYLVTRYRSTRLSVSLFVFLAVDPGGGKDLLPVLASRFDHIIAGAADDLFPAKR